MSQPVHQSSLAFSPLYNYGVNYSPTRRADCIPIVKLTDPSLNISYVRLTWVDLINTVRCRIIPLSTFMKLLRSSRPGVAVAKVALGMVALAVAPGFTCFGEYLYVPDLSTIRYCSYEPGTVSLMGWFREKTPYLGIDGKLSLDVPLCPRSTLQRVLMEPSERGLQFLVGFEIEFILLKSTQPPEAASLHSWSNTNAIPSGSVVAKTLKEIADSIQIAGIELLMYHAEGAPGQYEVVTGPLPPLEAADALIHTREIIYNTASKYGLHATFAPRVFEEPEGTGIHTHISIHSRNVEKVPDKLSSVESSFLASVLSNLPAITAITLPILASYGRMTDGVWSGGTYINWGSENREAPVRVANATSPSSRNFEMKFVDGTANSYLALAAIIGAGYVGIKNNVELTIKDVVGPLTAAEMSEEERQSHGITQRMSLTWEEARQNLNSNKVLKECVLGSELTDAFLTVNQTLVGVLSPANEDEAVTLKRLVNFY